MTDIWSGIGVDIDQDEGEWLYRVGTEVRGPMPHHQVVEKLLSGEVTLDTGVAREGTDFHPIRQVKAFAPHLEAAIEAHARRRAKKVRRLILATGIPVILTLASATYFLHREYTRRVAANARARLNTAPRPRQPVSDVPTLGLVALVSLGTQEDVKIKSAPARPAKEHLGKNLGRATRKQESQEGPASAEPQVEEEVQSCKLTQQEIFGTLRGALAKLNICVEDEKKRDTQNLLPASLELQFVVRTSGKVADFLIGDRHYRTGPLNNCMIKAFNTITFPSSTGANCPVTIPIKIGK